MVFCILREFCITEIGLLNNCFMVLKKANFLSVHLPEECKYKAL